MTPTREMPQLLCEEIEKLNLKMVNDLAVAVEIEPTLQTDIRKGQLEDKNSKEIRQHIKDSRTSDFF
jgi:hypothetical protein